VEARRDAETGDDVEHRAQDHVVPTETPAPKDRDGGSQGHHGSDDEEPQQGDLAVALPLLREEWLGTATGLFGHRFLTNNGGDNCPHLLSK
jgi:hypothetical protein